MKITRFSPIIKDDTKQLTLFPLNQEEVKLTLAEVMGYLKTADAEKSIKIIEEKYQVRGSN